jgi:Fic family protein
VDKAKADWKEPTFMEAKFFELDAKMDAVRAKMNSFPERVLSDYRGKLDVSWIYHDHALEGVVLSYSELKAAIDQRIISDVSLIPMYEEVKNHKLAVDFIREAVKAKKPPEVDLELIRKIYGILTPESIAKGSPYRKENPLHRLYYHEIAPPEKIGYKMRKIADWLASPEYANLHAIAQATRLQFKILAAYPWTKNSGKVARLVANYILIRAGYLPAVIHSIERQRYYEVLRHENEGLLNLILESLENSIDTTAKFFGELAGLKMKRAS